MIEHTKTIVEKIETPKNNDLNISSKLGLILIGNDAIELGVTEEIIARVLDCLKKKSTGIQLSGAVVINGISTIQVRRIYPALKNEFLEAFTKTLGKNTSVLVAYEQKDPTVIDFDFIKEINIIKGKIARHKTKSGDGGWGRSIRSAIPLPGDRERYEEMDKKLDHGTLSNNDYVKLTRHLVHSPDNEAELAGLYLLFEESVKKEMFGNTNTAFYDEWAQKTVA